MSTPTEPNGVLRRNSNLQTVGGIIVATLAICGCFWSMASKISTMEHDISEIKNQNVRSIDDRVIHARLIEENHKAVNDLQSSLSTEITERTKALEEIEVQFDSSDQLRNVQFSDTQRTIHIMWNKIPDLGPYPEGPYFHPNISKRSR